MSWWDAARSPEQLAQRFWAEARAFLPGIDGYRRETDGAPVFSALQNQRIRLEITQQLARLREATPKSS